MRVFKQIVLSIMVFILTVAATIVCSARFFSAKASADIPAPSEYYPTVGVVTELAPDMGLVIVETSDGNEWVFQGIEDWCVGDRCAMVMDNRGTQFDVTDDWIVSTRYFI